MKKNWGKIYRRGMIAGLAGLLAMDIFQGIYINASVALTGAAPDGKPPRSKNPLALGYQSQGGKGDNDANERAAARIVTQLRGQQLTQAQMQFAGPALHYVGGMLAGGLYGLICAKLPALGAWGGAFPGLLAWVGQDEIAVPLAGLAYGPDKYPLGLHLYGLAGHLAFGIALEQTRRALNPADE